MIVDVSGNFGLYRKLGAGLAKALTLLVEHDFRNAQLGRHEVDGFSLLTIVQSYETKPREQGVWESHRKYIDVQYVVEGIERIGWAPTALLSVRKPYDPDSDATLYDGDGDFLVVRPGTFLVLWPDDGHMPGIAVGVPAQVRKVVLKVLL